MIKISSVAVGVTKLLNTAFEPYKKILRKDFEAGFRKLMTADQYSTREYLRSHQSVIHHIAYLKAAVDSIIYSPHGYEAEGRCGLDFHTIQWLETNSSYVPQFPIPRDKS